jgi:hypothetical protein
MTIAERTVITGPYHDVTRRAWPWAVTVYAPGAAVEIRRFELRSQAQQYADHARAQAAWDEI